LWDVRRVHACEIGAEQAAESLSFVFEGVARGPALDAVCGRQFEQGQPALGLWIAGNPRGVKRLRQWNGNDDS
jgi:hypothetical protein